MSDYPPRRKSFHRIGFVGDAFTVGAGDETALGWIGRLAQREWAGNHDITVYNLGIRGNSTRSILQRWQKECEDRLPKSSNARLVFMFGGNDAKEEVGAGIEVPLEESVANAREIISRASRWLPTLWIGLIPMSEKRPYPQLLAGPQFAFSNTRQAEYNERYKQVANDLQVPFLDLHTPLSNDPVWEDLTQAGDGSNPAGAGYAYVAKMIGDWPAWRSWFDKA